MNKQIYFNSYANALDYCFNQITFTKKPSLNETNIITLDLLNDNYKLHIQVYRMNINTFELNYYIA